MGLCLLQAGSAPDPPVPLRGEPKGFSGILVADGYSGYNLVGNVVRAGCWAHMRRKWLEAMPKGATMEISKAAVGYDFCSHLFKRV